MIPPPQFSRVVIVAYNEIGRRIGETHHNAHIPDHLVDAIRDRHEDDGLGYIALAEEFRLSKNTIRKICTYERRAQTPIKWERMRIAPVRVVEDSVGQLRWSWQPHAVPVSRALCAQ